MVARQAGGVVLFQVINFTLLIANMGSGMGSQLAAGRLLYGMGRGNALPKSFFGAIEPKHADSAQQHFGRRGVCACRVPACLSSFADRLGGGPTRSGPQALELRRFYRLHGRECCGLRPPLAAWKKKNPEQLLCLPWAF